MSGLIMSNLENFNNIFANLAESAYNKRPNNFPYDELKKEYKGKIDDGESIDFNFSEDYVDKKTNKVEVKGGTNLPNNGVVYLQPDKILKTVEVKTNLQVPNPNGGYHTESYVNSYQKEIHPLADEKAGFNAYFVTDTAKLDETTRQTYLTIRGSDGASISSLNDWVSNDANFALTNTYIPQAKLANLALKEKIKELNTKASDAVLNVTGHSLGTMVSAQAVAKLYQETA